MSSIDLRRLKIQSGEQFREDREVELEALELGGQRYLPIPAEVDAELAIIRGTSGTTFELGFPARLHGPCYRCLKDAVLDLSIRAREYQATSPGESEELRTPYVADNQLQLSDWARDAIAVELPQQILCRPDCAGLCPTCGEDLNENPHEHEDDRPDPRWAALEQLKEKL